MLFCLLQIFWISMLISFIRVAWGIQWGIKKASDSRFYVNFSKILELTRDTISRWQFFFKKTNLKNRSNASVFWWKWKFTVISWFIEESTNIICKNSYTFISEFQIDFIDLIVFMRFSFLPTGQTPAENQE